MASAPDARLSLVTSEEVESLQSTAARTAREHLAALLVKQEPASLEEKAWSSLHRVLARQFDAQRDHIFCDQLAEANAIQVNVDGVRVDPAHSVQQRAHALRNQQTKSQLFSAIGAASAYIHLEQQSWVVVLFDDWTALSEDLLEEIRRLQHASARLLLILCENAEPESPRTKRRWTDKSSLRVMRLAEQCNIQYAGPLSAQDEHAISTSIASIKLEGSSALLHLRVVRPASSSVIFKAEDVRLTSPERGASLLRSASRALAQRAANDTRVVAMAMLNSVDLSEPWREAPRRFFSNLDSPQHGLAWSFGAAAVGCRPFVFLASDDLLEQLPLIRRELSTKKSAVSFIIHSSGDVASARSAALAALNLLPDTTVIAPGNHLELQNVLAWATEQDGPLAILLDDLIPAECEQAPPRSEQSLHEQRTADIALLCCGPTVAPAYAAATQLAEKGVVANVVHLTFLAPLDAKIIVKQVSGASYAVVLDSPSTSGLAGKVLTLLADRGVNTPISVIETAASQTNCFGDRQAYQSAVVCQILDSCGWLTESGATPERILTNGPDLTDVQTAAPTTGLTFFRSTNSTSQDQMRIRNVVLSPDVQQWLDTYLKVGKRGLYFWKWCAYGSDLTTIPGVLPRLRSHVCDTKTLSIMLCVLLDDVADQPGKGPLLDALLEIVDAKPVGALGHLNEEDRAYARETSRLADEYYRRVKTYPRYAEFEELLHYDQMQYFNTMKYSQLLNKKLELLNVTEHDLYMPHAMHMMSFATLDLMCMPQFSATELGKLREVVWHAACMGRIGNLVSTWRREIGECDFNSGVFARAINHGDLTVEQLANPDARRIEAAIVDGGHEDYFLHRWHHHRELLQARAAAVQSIDLADFSTDQERFFHMHLGSRGLI